MFAIVQLAVVLGLCATNIIATCNVENSVAPLNRTDGTPAGILRLLHEGERLLELEENDRDMVVFMGITGTGKTTFVLHMSGNDDDLTAKETRPRSGEYLIVDRCNRSSSAAKTLESFTLIPDRFIDSQTTMSYFDMPGFSDTRPLVAYDIAATYFTKIVLDYAKKIKLVFVVNHSHVKVGEDRGRFTELVQHITTLIGNLTKFQDSIALVATKVTNVVIPGAPADDPYVSDQEVAEGIAEFLEGANSFYKENNQMKAAQLVDIFLHRKNQILDRIAVFRRPDKPGPLTNMTTLQRSKRKTRAIIDTSLRFAEKNKSDFGYTLSEKSRNILHNLREEVLKNATDSIHAIGNRIQAYFQDREYAAADLVEITSVFNKSYIDVSPFATIAEFANYIDGFVKQVGLTTTDAEDIKVLRTNEKFMHFLNGISGDAAIDWSPAIQNGMGQVVEYLRHSQSWYIMFLNNMYDIFFGYEVQRARSRIDSSTSNLLTRIEELKKLPEMNLVDLDAAMTQFLKVVGDEPLTRSYSSLGPINLNTQKLQFLKKILNATLKHTVETTCTRQRDDNELMIRGRYVVLSQVVDELNSCPGARFIKIFAVERLFLDTSLNLTGKEVNLFMIASAWITIGQVEISLNGKSGGQYETTARGGILSTAQYLRNGKHGEPGAPGGSAGHFYGMGRDFVNDKQLTISAVGGNGGGGQKGGDGTPGESFDVARRYDGGDTDLSARYPGYNIKKTLKSESSGFWNGLGYFLGIAEKKKVYEIEIISPPPSAGGSGGNGGKGGIGGRGGNVTIVNFCTGREFSAKTITQDGKSGIAGEAGKGATGGVQAKALIENYSEKWFWWSNIYKYIEFDSYGSPKVPKAQDGSDGASGANDDGLQYPAFVTSRSPGSDITGYKAYARDNLPYDVRRNIRSTLGCL